MDAKSKANFINAVAGNQNIPCPKCDTLNEAGAKFCASCGVSLEKKEQENEIPFVPVKKVPEVKVQEVSAEPVKLVQPVEVSEGPESVFAEGLPSWDIEPPQVMVRRKKNK